MRQEEPSFAGMYGDTNRGNAALGASRIFVRLTGDAKGSLAKYTSNPSFVAVQARTPLAALERRQQALERQLSARGVVAGYSVDPKSGKVRVTTRQVAQARQAAPDIDTDPDTEVLDANPLPTPAVSIYGGKQVTYQSISGSTLTSDRGTLGFAVKSGTVSGILTAAHFGRCRNPDETLIAGCTVNGAAFYNPSNNTGQISGTPTLLWKAERLGGAYDAEWRTSSSDTFPNTIQYGASTPMNVTAVYNPDGLVVGSSKVCKQGFATGYTCGTFWERYNMLWFGSTGVHYLVGNDACQCPMAGGGDSGGPVFASGTAIGLVSGVFDNPDAGIRYNEMSFTSITLAASALGVTVKTAP